MTVFNWCHIVLCLPATISLVKKWIDVTPNEGSASYKRQKKRLNTQIKRHFAEKNKSIIVRGASLRRTRMYIQ